MGMTPRPAPREAWILAGTLDGCRAQPALLDPLAGLPYLLRVACDLALAGATRVVVVWTGDAAPPDIAAVARDPRLAARATLALTRTMC